MWDYQRKVIIATFFYKQQGYLDYINSITTTLLLLERMKIKFDYWPTSGNFHMAVCVNDVLSKFLRSEYDDIVLIDSDEGFDADSMMRLLMHDEEIVCGAYRLTNPHKREYPVCLTNDTEGAYIGKMLKDGNCLLAADKIPGGFLKIAKTALEKWVRAYPDDWLNPADAKIYTFFKDEIRDHVFNGMDYVFAETMKKAGVPLFVDPMCNIRHWGMFSYEGTLDSHLRLLKLNQESQWAFDEVAKMAKEVEAKRG